MPPEKAAAEVTAEPPAAPKGVVCILMDPKGRAWATASDFGDAAGDRREIQTRRAERMCALEFGRAAIAAPVIVGFEAWDIENLMHRLIALRGWRLHHHAIGYSEGEA